MILPIWRQFGTGGTGLGDGGAPAAVAVATLVDSQSSRWVHPFRTAPPEGWAIPASVAPPIITAP